MTPGQRAVIQSAILVMCHANSQQYLIEGAPYMERIWREVLALPL